MKNLPEAPVKKERISRKTLPPGLAKVMERLHFPLELILRCVRWSVAYSLSLRDLEEMIAEHGVEVDHSARSGYPPYCLARSVRHHALPAEVLQAATRR